MRLEQYEVDGIKKAFREAFEEGQIFLFGSRIDDTQRGGDIDLYLRPSAKFDDERDRRRNFLLKLDEYIGEQKIDVIMAKDASRLIEQEAIIKGIEL